MGQRCRSVSHGPDQPRTAPSSPPHRLHFIQTTHNFTAAALRQKTPCSSSFCSIFTPSDGETYRRFRSKLYQSLVEFLQRCDLFSSTNSAQRKVETKKFPHIPPQRRTAVTSARRSAARCLRLRFHEEKLDL